MKHTRYLFVPVSLVGWLVGLGGRGSPWDGLVRSSYLYFSVLVLCVVLRVACCFLFSLAAAVLVSFPQFPRFPKVSVRVFFMCAFVLLAGLFLERAVHFPGVLVYISYPYLT